MTVSQLLTYCSDYEFVSVETDEYSVISSGEAQTVRNAPGMKTAEVCTFYVGNRFVDELGKSCYVLIVIVY